ncbi:hypothetical protein KSU1_B0111 [Candidatus Jettenia caeni]|uniref:Uncharacterized protein n=1 Tax=Candidatus Jettenia caeni TaxID=247490 RepID=I3IGX3_9BACT|nr:hypothetical protein [Candidatus Jettenia caeni]GAB60968.1 hypothetical protein KSU1_B0111 [Candidatus Jettenia caeni]
MIFQNNIAIVPHTCVLSAEIKNSVLKALGGTLQISTRTQIIQKGLWFALGFHPEI